MTYIQVNTRSNRAKAFLEFIKDLPFVKIIEKKDIPDKETSKAMRDVQLGKVNKYKNAKEMFEKLDNHV